MNRSHPADTPSQVKPLFRFKTGDKNDDGSPLNPWDFATCVSLYMKGHTASRQLPGTTCSAPHRTGKQKCESLLTLVTAFHCHDVPPRLASRPPRKKLTDSP
ncbi:hypothetical protein QQF64_021225 [Cirrhinus molitorella]|uniref:Uncharacterized protein n=1 Tax=Cirrhinus molitorella TaxID=172907 RepID=A0ABR3LBD5_9TELE